jgi:hypothetical protein
MNTEFWWVNLLDNGHMEERGGGRTLLGWISGRQTVRMEGRCNWLRIMSSGSFWY